MMAKFDILHLTIMLLGISDSENRRRKDSALPMSVYDTICVPAPWHFQGKERLGEASVCHHGVYHLQSFLP
jgi:hypothetical protein